MSGIARVLSAGVAALALVAAFATTPLRAGEEEEEMGAPPRAMLLFPIMDPARGRALFASKGCVVCHAVNGVGGHDGPALDLDPDRGPVNPFELAAEMWKHAGAMIPMQEEEFGHQIELTADEFADLVAFLASPSEQKAFSEADIPPDMREILEKELQEEGEEEYGR